VVTQEQATLPLGTVIRAQEGGGRYEIEGLLGRGGFSAIYLVRDRIHHARVYALKELIHPDQREREQFFSEASILKRLDHPALPRVYQLFEDAKHKRIYLLMDYIEGKDLEALRRQQPEKRFPLKLALKMLMPIVDALCYMHAQQRPIIHRDIKPSNIIVSAINSETRLVDFGLAKEYIADQTTSIFRYGTPGYAAPEQYHQGTRVQTDVYGLGATLYTLITGLIPPDALTRVMTSGNDPLIPADQADPTIPASIAHVIEQAMSLHLQNRFPSVEAFWYSLNSALQEATGTTTDHLLNTPLPFTTEDLEIFPTIRLLKRPLVPRFKKRAVMISLIVVGLIALATNIFLLNAYWIRSVTTAGSPPTAVQTMVATTLASPTTTSFPVSSPYPLLGLCYAGTAHVHGVKNGAYNIYLMNVQQTEDKVSGDFRGLEQVSSFQGTVDAYPKDGAEKPKPNLHFTVPLPNLEEQFIFEGTIEIGGDVAGSFYSVNKAGQRDNGYYGDYHLQQCSG
jgi:serine/threonine protein kinase